MDNEVHELVGKRCAFFANRVDTYARAVGLDSKGVVDHLQHLVASQGEDKITGIIDSVVPPELHSSKMPDIIRKHYGEKQ